MDPDRIFGLVNAHSYPNTSTPNPPPRAVLEADPELEFRIPSRWDGDCVCHDCIFNVCRILNTFYHKYAATTFFKQRVSPQVAAAGS